MYYDEGSFGRKVWKIAVSDTLDPVRCDAPSGFRCISYESEPAYTKYVMVVLEVKDMSDPYDPVLGSCGHFPRGVPGKPDELVFDRLKVHVRNSANAVVLTQDLNWKFWTNNQLSDDRCGLRLSSDAPGEVRISWQKTE